MKAAYFDQFAGPITIETLAQPALPADGVIIRVEASGLCRSDWHGWMGHDPDVTLPHVPGHELAGVVVQTGAEVRRWQPGDRVTVPFAVGCGRCPQCRSGNQQICDDYFQPGFTAWGSFAQYVAIPYADANLVRLPDEIDFVTAATLGCRFTTAFRAVADQGRAGGGQWVAVHGCGGVGLSAIMIASALGASVVGVDIGEESLALAREIGAVHTVNARAVDDVPEAIHTLTGGGAHVSLDALGSAETCRNSVLSLRKRGRHVQVGLIVSGETPVPMARVIAWELELLGSHGMPAHHYSRLLEMIRSGKLAPGRLVGERIHLDEVPTALPAMADFGRAGVTVIDSFA
jgi:alcohol dehydrogenase